MKAPNFRQPKRRGEWAEVLFMLRAMERGLIVSKPYGDSARFDFVVGSHRQYRVQVRSTRIFMNRSYMTRFTWATTSSKYRKYRKNDFDILAVYVVPCDTWYIIPMTAIRPARSISAFTRTSPTAAAASSASARPGRCSDPVH